jgi:hypothetical protein
MDGQETDYAFTLCSLTKNYEIKEKTNTEKRSNAVGTGGHVFLTLEYGTDRSSRNVGKELLLHAP